VTQLAYDVRTSTADVDGEPVSNIDRTRARAYPGLNAAAPLNRVFYEEACEQLAGAKVVWDVGTGSGFGAAILAERHDCVIAIDPDATARAFATRLARNVVVVASGEEQPSPDGAAVIDVLGHVTSPFALLRDLRKNLEEGARVFVAEAAAYPNQTLVHPARRAFSVSALEGLADAAGFRVAAWTSRAGTFLACTLVAVEDDGAKALEQGAMAMSAGDAEAARESYERAAASPHRGVQREAALAMADLHYAMREGDLACAAYMRAHEIDSADPRPLAALAQLLCEAEDIKTAARFAQEAVALEPADAGAQVAMAVVLEAASAQNSLESWRKASSLAPDQSEVVSRYATLALGAGDATSALLALDRARSFGEDDGPSLNIVLTRVLLALGRKADAKGEASLAKAKAPDHPAVLALLAEVDAAS